MLVTIPSRDYKYWYVLLLPRTRTAVVHHGLLVRLVCLPGPDHAVDHVTTQQTGALRECDNIDQRRSSRPADRVPRRVRKSLPLSFVVRKKHNKKSKWSGVNKHPPP